MSDATVERRFDTPPSAEVVPASDVLKVAAGAGDLCITHTLLPEPINDDPAYLRQHLPRLANMDEITEQRRASLRERGLPALNVHLLDGDRIKVGSEVEFHRAARELLGHLICRYGLPTTTKDLWKAGFGLAKRPPMDKQPLVHELRKTEEAIKQAAPAILRTLPGVLNPRIEDGVFVIDFAERACLVDARKPLAVVSDLPSIAEQVRMFVQGEADELITPVGDKAKHEFMKALSAQIISKTAKGPEADEIRSRIQRAQIALNPHIMTKPNRRARPHMP